MQRKNFIVVLVLIAVVLLFYAAAPIAAGSMGTHDERFNFPPPPTLPPHHVLTSSVWQVQSDQPNPWKWYFSPYRNICVFARDGQATLMFYKIDSIYTTQITGTIMPFTPNKPGRHDVPLYIFRTQTDGTLMMVPFDGSACTNFFCDNIGSYDGWFVNSTNENNVILVITDHQTSAIEEGIYFANIDDVALPSSGGHFPLSPDQYDGSSIQIKSGQYDKIE